MIGIDDEVIQDYLAESREHLANIENDLLDVERDGAEIDEKRVNRVFRAAHSIKGGAGFFDLLTIKELAHKTENVLEMVRSRQIVPRPDVVSILLKAFDKLRDLIDNYRESNQADTSECLVALTRVAANNMQEAEAETIDQAVIIAVPGTSLALQATALDLAQAKQSGKRLYAVNFDMIRDIQRLGQTPLDVFRKLMVCGNVLDSAVDLQAVGTLSDEPSSELLLEVLYATPLDSFSISQVFQLREEQIRLVEPAPLRDLALSQAQPIVVPAMTAPVTPMASSVVIAKPSVVPVAPQPVESAPKSAPVPPTQTQSAPIQQESTIRLNVTLLDTLMTQAGELVLSRNQLNEAIAQSDENAIRTSAHRINLVTSELQDVVALTRMQPVGSLFAKFPRLVRDLASSLGKEVNLQLEGNDVELDKSLLEGLSDPLTHMVRNSVDHGIEMAAVRTQAGKTAAGTVWLRARHQAGQVVIEIADDGKGLSGEKIAASAVAKGLITQEQVRSLSDHEKAALIFLPGVSTAEKVTDVSGRGVGMDVVKTNLDKLGGKVEIVSTPGKGTAFQIKLPLTLAIIPSLLVSCRGERFALPQASVREMIRIPKRQWAERIYRAGSAEVVILRDRLVPLVSLAQTLGIPDMREEQPAINIVLVDTGAFEYGLAVEDLHDSVEIVVKPLGRHLQAIADFAGATILGDGKVALILDVTGLAARADLTANDAEAVTKQQESAEVVNTSELHSLLMFHNAPDELCAVPIELVTRIEHIEAAQVESTGGRRTMQYLGSSLPLITLHDVCSIGDLNSEQKWAVIVLERAGNPVGLLVAEPIDMVETQIEFDKSTLRQTGIAGSAIIGGRTTLLVDLFELVETVRRDWPGAADRQSTAIESAAYDAAHEAAKSTTILVAEDSDFFRGQIRRLIESVGYRVITAEDGQAAWEMLDSHPDEISLVTTDVEMPRLDGLGLAQRIRNDSRFTHLPVIALSSLAGDEEIAHGLAMGVTEYQVKLDQDQLLDGIRRAIHSNN